MLNHLDETSLLNLRGWICDKTLLQQGNFQNFHYNVVPLFAFARSCYSQLRPTDIVVLLFLSGKNKHALNKGIPTILLQVHEKEGPSVLAEISTSKFYQLFTLGTSIQDDLFTSFSTRT